MVDVVTPAVRSRMMSGIRGKHTKPEMLVRGHLTAAGLRYRLHLDLPGAPDIVLPSRKAAIFVHGCFWHAHAGCRLAATPSTRAEFNRPQPNNPRHAGKCWVTRGPASSSSITRRGRANPTYVYVLPRHQPPS